jgi:hypothetical protein
MKFLDKKDLKQTYTLQVCKSINPVLEQLITDLNILLMTHFDSERVATTLFRRYRKRYIGFNNTFSIDFLLYLYDQLQDEDNISNLIKPILDEYINNQSLKRLTKKDTAHNRTIKVSPYIRGVLSETKDDLNAKLRDLFGEEVFNVCLNRDIRGKWKKPFTIHYMIDFLIFLFNQIKLNKVDLVEFIIPTMDSFLYKKEKIIIREE